MENNSVEHINYQYERYKERMMKRGSDFLSISYEEFKEAMEKK